MKMTQLYGAAYHCLSRQKAANNNNNNNNNSKLQRPYALSPL